MKSWKDSVITWEKKDGFSPQKAKQRKSHIEIIDGQETTVWEE